MKRGLNKLILFAIATRHGFSKTVKPNKQLAGEIARDVVRTTSLIVLILVVSFSGGLPAVPELLKKVHAAGTHTIIFWDGTDYLGGALSVPTDWSVVTTYDGYYPRGETVANFGNATNNGTHTPTVATTTVGGGSANRTDGVLNAVASAGHTHTANGSATIGSASNSDEPAYRSLKIIQYDPGVATEIPAGGIVMFDNNPGIPDTGWSRQSAQDGKFVKVNSSVGTGGADTHNHSVAFPSLNNSSGSANRADISGNAYASDPHPHAAPSNSNTSDTCSSSGCLPPYIQPLFAKATGLVEVPIGMITMFDGDPGTGWLVRSKSTGSSTETTFYQQFLRPNTTWNGTSQGSASHTHSNVVGTTGTAQGIATGTGSGGGAASPSSHTHNITLSFNSAENLPPYFNVVIAQKTGTTMLLFWDGTDHLGGALSIPNGWSEVHTFSGKFVRGESPSNYGTTGGGTTHTATATFTTGQASGQNGATGNQNNVATYTHTHGFSGNSISTGNSDPASRTLRLIRNDSGSFNTIPKGAIALFDGSPGMPGSGWTRQSSFDDRFVTVHDTASTNNGVDTHTHTVTWGSLAASTGQAQRGPLFFNINTATAGHTHNSVSNTTTSTNGTSAADCDAAPVADQCLPKYVQTVLGKANSDTPTISIGFSAMFDGDPGGGWVVRSDSSGPFYQKYIRGGSTYSEECGQTGILDGKCGELTHTHANATTTSALNNGGSGGTAENLGGQTSENNHTHPLTATFNASGNNEPPYFNVVIAEKVNFILNAYYWYYDDGTVTPDFKWANPDLNVSSPIITLPIAAADPPEPGDDLRMRIQILINGNNLAASVITFKVQYNATRSTSCTATTGSWVDVSASGSTSAGTKWRYTSSVAVSDNSLIDALPGGAVFTSPATTVRGHYVKSANAGLNTNGANIGDYIEYDFHINNYDADGATQYSFRILETNGTLLSQYSACPTLTTKPRTENQLRHGNFFNPDPAGDATTNLENGFSWVD